jgi:HSP20 family protein
MLRTLVNVEPTEIRSIEEVFDRLFGQPTRPVHNSTTLPVDVTEHDGSLFIKAAVPGVDPKDLEITIENNVLSIRGETRNETHTDNEKIYRREVSYGAFSRSIRLPEKLDHSGISAEFSHGMVTVKLPRQPEVKPQILKVEVKNLNANPTENLDQPSN